jgi:uncharacterized membrane protein HdeD (DUF308 family)
MGTFVADVAKPIQEARRAWGWYLTLGIVLVAIGVYAIVNSMTATFASVVVLGAVVLIAGIVQIVAAFQSRGAGHVILLLLVGALDIVVGLMLMQHPLAGALTVTLLLAALFVFGGIFRFVSALWLQFPQYGWVAFSGVITFVLGILLWAQWPVSAMWFIGFAVGINFIFAGISWSALAWKLKAA